MSTYYIIAIVAFVLFAAMIANLIVLSIKEGINPEQFDARDINPYYIIFLFVLSITMVVSLVLGLFESLTAVMWYL